MNDELHLNDYSSPETKKNNPKLIKVIFKEGGLCFIYSLILSVPLFFLCSTSNMGLGESGVCYGQGLAAMMFMGIMIPILFIINLILLIIPVVVFGFLVYKTKEKINNRGIKICLVLILYVLFYLLVSIFGAGQWYAAMGV